MSAANPTVCFAILNYNGRHHLEHLLPSACLEAAAYDGQCDVVVIDNQSTEPDVEWIREEFPSVSVVVAPKNEFLLSYNWFAATTDADLLVLLNNDLKLCSGFVAPLVEHFKDEDVFAVSARSVEWGGGRDTSGPMELHYRRGVISVRCDYGRQELSPTAFAVGGFAAVDRKKFISLGGFDRIFSPAYGEDLDLSIRGWCRGWHIIYEPRSVCWHRDHASIDSAVGNREADLMRLRAMFWFSWRTFRGARWCMRHSVGLLYSRWLVLRGGSSLPWIAGRQALKDWIWRDRRNSASTAAPSVSKETLGNVVSRDLGRLLKN